MLQSRVCQQCGITFMGGPRAYYCPDCRIERRKEQSRVYKSRKRAGKTRSLGSIDKCERCGNDYIVNSGLQRFCDDCQEPHAKEHDRVTGIEYYRENKNEINPVRNIRRRIGTKNCVWCGKEFETSTRSITCSEECKRLRKNYLWNLNNKNKSNQL